ncbi:hypothetical protein C8Q77DRAFT_1063378 [Trametes polyzona]|nr:hypothetical protein C8Q77DRAFT_1063378 [Trametes polyzona]
MTGTLALMLQVPPTGLPCEPAPGAPKPNIRPSIQPRPTGPRRPRTRSELNDIRLRRASAAVACPVAKHSLPTPGILPKHRRHSSRDPLPPAPSSTSASSLESRVANAPSSLAMTTTTTTTMTLPPPSRLRVSESTPPFLLQHTHGPPPYFLYRNPTTVPQRGPSTPPLKQKRSFTIGAGLGEPSKSPLTSAPPTPPADAGKFLPHIPIPAPVQPAPRRPAMSLAARHRFPNMSPPPEKALPPIPFPSHSPPPTPRHAYHRSRSLLLPAPAPARPVSQDEEETLRQLEQLAAELRQMGAGSLVEVNPSRTRGTPRRRPREGANAASKGVAASLKTKASLSVPRIVVTNPSMENLGRGLEAETETPAAGARTPDSDDGSGEVTEEELWVEQYGGWGTSDKGKWKASAADEDAAFHDSVSSPPPPAELDRARSTSAAKPAEVFYIYEPIGAPEFLVGSSSSPIARATPGYHSRRPAALSPKQQVQQDYQANASARRRRRRPTALVLATPEQAEWFEEAVLGSAPLPSRPSVHHHSYHPFPTSTSTSTQRALPTPEPMSARNPSITPPSPRLPPRRALSSDAADASSSSSASASTHEAHLRRSEPYVAMPRMASTSALRDDAVRSAHGLGSQSASWPPPQFLGETLGAVSNSSSEPNSPRQGSRPRLKSFKGLFKHFSK